jgi:hypothetical protein
MGTLASNRAVPKKIRRRCNAADSFKDLAVFRGSENPHIGGIFWKDSVQEHEVDRGAVVVVTLGCGCFSIRQKVNLVYCLVRY